MDQKEKPFTLVEHKEGFEIRSATGKALAYVYFEDADNRRRDMRRLTNDEARAFANKILSLGETNTLKEALDD